jgi:hypothetical protein
VFTKADWLRLSAAFFSFLFSVALWFGIGMGASKEAGVFVGIWVPSILSAGSYFRQAARTKGRRHGASESFGNLRKTRVWSRCHIGKMNQPHTAGFPARSDDKTKH